MKRDAVSEYVEQSESVLDSSPQMDEANTKAAILRDFLNLLDWQIPFDTQLEYSVKAFGQTYKVDYALVLEGTPVAFLEAKGVDTTLSDSHREQLSSYMTNENVKYGILTNGAEYEFLQRRLDGPDVSVQTVARVPLQNLPERLSILRAYTKEAIQDGEAAKILTRINELRTARSVLKSEKDQVADELTTVLTEHVSEAIEPLAHSQSKQLVDRLVSDIEHEIASDGTDEQEVDDEGFDAELEDVELEPLENHVVGTIRRGDIEGPDDARVAVFPTQISGLTFLMENNAWGYVRISEPPDYVAMYVTDGISEVQYFATARDIISQEDAELQRPVLEYVDGEDIDENKMIVRFEPESLYRLEDPVPYETKYPQSLRYTTLGALRTAETTDDMF